MTIREEWGCSQPVQFAQAKLYDSSGKEIQVPDGYTLVCGKESFAFVKNDGYVADFVYKQPDQTTEKYKACQKWLSE